MRIFKIISLCLFALIATCGCSTPRYLPNTYTVTNIKEFDKSFDKTWRAISDMVANWGLSPNTIDKQSGLMIISGVTGNTYSSYCDCGTLGNGIGYYQNFDYPTWKASISVTSISENKCKVKINTFYNSTLRLYEMNFNNNKYYETSAQGINCNSKGALETSIFNYIEVFNQ